jgi:hypothetical protein
MIDAFHNRRVDFDAGSGYHGEISGGDEQEGAGQGDPACRQWRVMGASRLIG